ncbi:MAG: 4-hydroxythreonine-4-phosphate dehydrogenase PdxA [candidate division WOR-3 bacterium]|nr:4-hydroxythreonine-4-phosphate dehydrogenase PdxA [candidate division WOR-3 bacterium]
MLLITLGEISGIGPEIVLKAIRYFSPKNIKIIGSKGVLEKTIKKLKIKIDYEPYLLELLKDIDFQFGKPTKDTAYYALNSLEIAVSLIKEKKYFGVITAPICKENLRKVGFKYPGHTEFFAQSFNIKKYSLLAYTKYFKVAFVTLHLPLANVKKELNAKKIYDTAFLLYQFLSKIENIRNPRILFFSFNPHLFEFSLGEEELIKRAIKELAKFPGYYDIKPADALPYLLGNYDGYVALYHDQGMIPAKLLSEGKGVNITLGLPFIRTSPLHGVGLDIAGKNQADEKSMIRAIELALKWYKKYKTI